MPFKTRLTVVSDVFVTKLNAAGSALVYSTYLGGSGSDFGLWDRGGLDRQCLCDGTDFLHRFSDGQCLSR